MSRKIKTWQRRVPLDQFCTGLGIPLANKRDLSSIFIFTLPAITIHFVRFSKSDYSESEQWEQQFWSKKKFLKRLGLPASESSCLINANVHEYANPGYVELRYLAYV